MSEPPRLPPAHPLAWPAEWPRAERRRLLGAPFRVDAPRAHQLLAHELENWTRVAWRPAEERRKNLRQRQWVVTSNLACDWQGRPTQKGTLQGARVPDPGVAVWWQQVDWKGGGLQVVACDMWPTVNLNMRACGVVIESLRAMERAGASQALEHAEVGLTALGLPAPRVWWREALDLDADPFTVADVERAYKRAALRAHPDQGGSHEAFIMLQKAREEALRHATPAKGAG